MYWLRCRIGQCLTFIEETTMSDESSKSSESFASRTGGQKLLHAYQRAPLPPGKIFRSASLLLVLSSFMAGCLTAPVYTVKNIPDQPTCTTDSSSKEILVGLAVSGGGSRAALFAAGAYEALGKIRVGPEQQSLLNQVSHISSVSGEIGRAHV